MTTIGSAPTASPGPPRLSFSSAPFDDIRGEIPLVSPIDSLQNQAYRNESLGYSFSEATASFVSGTRRRAHEAEVLTCGARRPDTSADSIGSEGVGLEAL